MLTERYYETISKAIVQRAIDLRSVNYPYIPERAFSPTLPEINEYSGKIYKVRFFPLEYGDEKDGTHGSYVRGYAIHEEDLSLNQMVIGSVPGMASWSDVFESTNGFYVTFQYAGYSEIYKKVYGFYIKHEIAPDFDQCA